MKSKDEIKEKLELIQKSSKEASGKDVRRGYELALLWVLDLDIG